MFEIRIQVHISFQFSHLSCLKTFNTNHSFQGEFLRTNTNEICNGKWESDAEILFILCENWHNVRLYDKE